MGVRERKKKEKKKSKEEAATKEEKPQVEENIESIIQDNTQPHETQVIEKESAEPINGSQTEVFKEVSVESEILLPAWGSIEESEWMYHIPTREEDKTLWAEEWGDFVLEWAQKETAHKISLTTFITEAPFCEMIGKVEGFRIISDELVEKGVAEWLGKNRSQLRIYWRPIEEWADIIYAWAIETGKTRLDVKTLVIQESDQDFASLPEEELRTILGILVKRDLANWVDKKRAAIKIRV